jgi:ribosomal protein S18 acetylase RimI-like enzyme
MAQREDTAVLDQLLQKAAYRHVHAGWYQPSHWLGQSEFVMYVEPEQDVNSFVDKLFGRREPVRGCLVATADPPPTAWVRVAAIRRTDNSLSILTAMMGEVEKVLRHTAVTQLVWMPVTNWPEWWFAELGFTLVNQIQTFVKDDLTVPSVDPVPDLVIRAAQVEDVNRLAEIEVIAFAPMWRHSANSLLQALRQVFSFDVALWGDELVGFQISTRNGRQAHLARITIDPTVQGQGIGTTLLAHAITTYQQRGLQSASLNTQVDNIASQPLYRKFGFMPEGQRLSIWAKTL